MVLYRQAIHKKERRFVAHLLEKSEMFRWASLRQLIESDTPIEQMDIRTLFTEYKKDNVWFPCAFRKNASAWISEHNGQARYFTKPNQLATYQMYDIYDLISLFTDTAVPLILRKYGHINPIVQYRDALEGYNQQFKEMTGLTYPYLHMLLKNHKAFYEIFLNEAKECLYTTAFFMNNKVTFFTSNSYMLARYSAANSLSTINGILNTYCVLGLIQKIKPEHPLLKNHPKNTCTYNTVHFYMIQPLESVIEEAEERAKQLLKAKITVHNLSRRKIATLFGESFEQLIYPQKTFGRIELAIDKHDVAYLEVLWAYELSMNEKVSQNIVYKESGLTYRNFQKAMRSIYSDGGVLHE